MLYTTSHLQLPKGETALPFATGDPRRVSVVEFDTDFVFEPEDMTDENGNGYTIVIWSERNGRSDHKADPSVCGANINCEVTYADESLPSAHAIVFDFEREIEYGYLEGIR